MERRQVETPKSFFIKERDQFYADWTLSFWREFFQNSVDAGSKNIDIRISTTGKRGSFEEAVSEPKEVTRVVFSDDGCGMTQDVLDNVYFAIGASTKDDESTIGGFGRARLMTCFSQDRYSIVTGDRFVLGDGPNYVNMELSEAIGRLTEINDLHVASRQEGIGDTVRDIDIDIDLLKNARLTGGYNGCRVEVDLDPESGGSWHGKPTLEKMQGKLKEYLSESQLPCNVTINGQTPEAYFGSEDKIRTRRGAVKRTLSIPGEDGERVEFATVHTSESARAAHKGRVIIRVDGASMFTESIQDENIQVVIELKREHARQAMNSNRDSLKGEYKESFGKFLEELVIDNLSALEEKKAKEAYTIPGELGRKHAERPSIRTHINKPLQSEEHQSIQAQAKPGRKHEIKSEDDLVALGIPTDVFSDFVDRAVDYQDSFVDEAIGLGNEGVDAHRETFRKAKNAAVAVSTFSGDRVNAFLSESNDDLTKMIVGVLKNRLEQEQEEVSAESRRKLTDFTDVTVKVVSANSKTKAAIRRNDPRNWDEKTGHGRASKTLLASWTAACSVAVEALMKTHPHSSTFNWNTGWVYSAPEKKWDTDAERVVHFSAMCAADEDGGYSFLLNPVNPDGTLKYKTSNPKDRQRLQAIAMHEVAHVLQGYHNEAYAGILTDLMEEYDFAEANRRMKEAAKAVYAAYERGKANVQAMDDEPGTRPADRLLEMSNGYVPVDRPSPDPDGVTTVNCDLDQTEAAYEPPISESELDQEPRPFGAFGR